MSEDLRVIQKGDLDTVDIGKASIIAIDGGVAQRSQDPQEEGAQLFKQAGALPPPYDPETLCRIFENSSSLRQNVDAYVTNIDAFGYRLEPAIDLAADTAFEQVQNALFTERLHDMEDDSADPAMPEETEVRELMQKLTVRMAVEKTRLTHFFDFINPEMSFTTIRRRLRQDMEVVGNAYVEILRNKAGDIAQVVYVSGFTMRLMPLDGYATPYTTKVKLSEISIKEVETSKRFRRFIQVFQGHNVIYFKEFGDPRILSSATGKYYKTPEAMVLEEGESARAATEILHFEVHSPSGPYGVPRWIGNLLAVLGSRQAEEVNFLLFENKAVPPMAILVSGGRLASGVVAKIKEYLEAMKGKASFHSVLVLEAVPASAPMPGVQTPHTGTMRIEIKPLMNSANNDAMFMKYDERNMDKVGMSFRLPRLLRGDIRDFNRATAEASLLFAEQQVFGPEREEFDFIINRKLMTALNAKYWNFQSNAPVVRDPERLANILKTLREYITPGEARDAIGDVLNRNLKKIDAAWTEQPAPFTLAGMKATDTPDVGDTEPNKPAGGEGGTAGASDDQDTEDDIPPVGANAGGEGGDSTIDETLQQLRGSNKQKKKLSGSLLTEAATLINLRNKLLNAEAKVVEDALKDARGVTEGANGELVVRIPIDEMSKLFQE